MDDLQKHDRTWLCSVVFVDIVDYSVQPVSLQATWKDRLNHHLAVGIQDVPEQDRVILDTGDGAAICFLGDPEAAVFCALRLLGALLEEEPERTPPFRARVGINLGPVKLVRDINGNLNAIGDGINVGQRVMSFAKENQVLVSRSFYEVVSCLSEGYVRLFRYEGVRRDKHVREHTVYELLPPGARGAAATPVPGAAPGPERSPHLTALRERIEGCIAPIVGPMAHYLVLKASAQAASPGEIREALLAWVVGGADQERLRRAWDEEFEADEGAELASPSAAVPWRTPPTTPAAAFEPELLERVRRELALYLGPVARVVVARAAARARTEVELLDLAAEHIPDLDARARFFHGLGAAPWHGDAHR